MELESQRAKVSELEKKQRRFDQLLAEEKAVCEKIAAEKDNVEREAREKETRVLALTRELDEALMKIEELERSKKLLQNELDDLVNSQGTTDKNVSYCSEVLNSCKDVIACFLNMALDSTLAVSSSVYGDKGTKVFVVTKLILKLGLSKMEGLLFFRFMNLRKQRELLKTNWQNRRRSWKS